MFRQYTKTCTTCFLFPSLKSMRRIEKTRKNKDFAKRMASCVMLLSEPRKESSGRGIQIIAIIITPSGSFLELLEQMVLEYGENYLVKEREREIYNCGMRDSCRKRAYNDSVAVYE